MESPIIRIVHGKQIFKETIAMASLDRKIRKELGYPLNSEQGQFWWIYRSDEEVLLGFCSMVIKPDSIYFCHDFVYPQYRGNGIYNRLFETRFNYAIKLNKPIKAMATKMSLNTYLRYGFKLINSTKNYNFVIYDK